MVVPDNEVRREIFASYEKQRFIRGKRSFTEYLVEFILNLYVESHESILQFEL